ncbi:MAG: 50S ribosomal protein L2 [Candidatus Aenigmatarchaeota archaeon]|nr:50S ribosomal protein L2 [Candidatus Aenigmarchaeota archaeon]
MGKRIISRARGKGGPRYRAPSHRYVAEISSFPKPGEYIVKDIVHDPGRSAPLALLKSKEGEIKYIIAAEGLKVGEILNIGGMAYNGNVTKLKNIPKGSPVFAIENVPNGGPKFCCSSGTYAFVIANEEDKVILQMPSREFKTLSPECLACVGYPAGGGRIDKPFVKAGQVFYAKRARNKLWPRSSANKMNPVDHPFGGRTKPGWPKTVSRNAPPGQKVGSIAARRTGKRKK